jgi:predicted PurR-regulated permease PerM
MANINNQHIRQISFYILLSFLAVFLFLQLSAFLPALLGAITFYLLLRKKMLKLVYTRKWSNGLAASVLLILSFLIVLVPIGFFISILSQKVNYAIGHSNQVISSLQQFLKLQETNYHIEILSDENLKKISLAIANFLPSVLGATVEMLTTIIMMYIILYFMLVSSKPMEQWLTTYIPMKDSNVILLGHQLDSLVYSNAIGIPLTALVQGIVALLGYWVAGVPDLGFWFVFTCITAMVPVVGLGLSYIPISLLLIANGESTKAILLILYCALIVGTADNFFRLLLMKKLGDVHPLITIFGVIIGLNLFGFIGLIFGPILISVFILLIRIYINEFSKEETELIISEKTIEEKA